MGGGGSVVVGASRAMDSIAVVDDVACDDGEERPTALLAPVVDVVAGRDDAVDAVRTDGTAGGWVSTTRSSATGAVVVLPPVICRSVPSRLSAPSRSREPEW